MSMAHKAVPGSARRASIGVLIVVVVLAALGVVWYWLDQRISPRTEVSLSRCARQHMVAKLLLGQATTLTRGGMYHAELVCWFNRKES
jgi:hypothetical protein